jgi:hypothetical protein
VVLILPFISNTSEVFAEVSFVLILHISIFLSVCVRACAQVYVRESSSSARVSNEDTMDPNEATVVELQKNQKVILQLLASLQEEQGLLRDAISKVSVP